MSSNNVIISCEGTNYNSRTRRMENKRYKVTLTQEERKALEAKSSKGVHRSQKVINALILLSCDVGVHQEKHSKYEEIAAVLNISTKKI